MLRAIPSTNVTISRDAFTMPLRQQLPEDQKPAMLAEAGLRGWFIFPQT